ncbi:MAG TPA: FtsX-like permease family protein, partial [Vicinamibacterales bacterium]|nr:FtsX-like permease family protein [Vicinamibacterales bacterium]
LTESALLAAAGGLLGLVVAHWTTRLLVAALSQQARTLRLEDVGIDGSVLAFTAIVSLATGVLFGALPAMASVSLDVNEALRDGGRSATSLRAPHLRSALVVAETALALILLAGAGTLLRAFLTIRATHPGFETEHILAVDLYLPQPRFAQPPARTRFIGDALERVTAVPGVAAAAFVADLPLDGGHDSQGFHIPGRPDPAPGKAFTSGFNIATAGYFRVMGIPVRSGREFTDRDGPDAPPVLVVNETAARRFWPGESPVGRQIDLPVGTTSVRLTIIGVTGDVRHVGLASPARPEMFVAFPQAPLPWPWLALTVRAHGDPMMLTDPIMAALRAADPNVPSPRASTLERIVSRSILEPRLYTALVGTFAALAMILAAVGLYGLIAYSVAQRTHEFGVRVALGATRQEIVRLVLRQGVWLIGVGAALGLAGALAATRAVVALVSSSQPNDPMTLALVTAVLTAAALLASYVPARRAARVDPMVALRTD